LDTTYYLRPTHQRMLNFLYTNPDLKLGPRVYTALEAIPRWRFIRRKHLERQLVLAVFADECVAIGRSQASIRARRA